jgi:translation initiation factor IF-3
MACFALIGLLCSPINFLGKKERYMVIKELYQVNESIRDKEVRLIGADGAMLGVMGAQQALRLAEEAELDLVKISPNAVPPVCKIMDYSKFKYEQAKKDKENRKNQTVVEIKEIRLSMTIDVGDIAVKTKQCLKFLEAGNKVKVSIRMKGRENARSYQGVKVMQDFFDGLGGKAVQDKKPAAEGRMITMMLSPAKA